MPALLTQRDRLIHGLRISIEQQERWLADADDDHDRDFHRARIADLERQLAELEEKN
jgi:hypothetical protein